MLDDRSPPAPQRPGCLSYGLFALALLWICALVGLSAPAAWFIREALVSAGRDWPGSVDLLVALGQALALALPLGLLAFFTRPARLRAAYQTWLLAACCLALYGLARTLPASWTQAAGLLAILCGLLPAMALRYAARRRPAPPADSPPLAVAALGLLLAAPAAAPWLLFGALGSPLDTLLALLAGAALGLLAAALLDAALLPALRAAPAGPGRDIGLGGLVAGGALLILAAGAGFGASNLLLLAALPPLGFAAAALALLARGRRAWLAPAGLLGGAAAAALALFDPDEITILLGGADMPRQALAAAGWAALLGLIISAGMWVAGARAAALARPAPARAGLALAWAAALAIYALAGHPGFYGEQLFVILRDQADLSPAAALANRPERLRFVYATLTAKAAASQADMRATLDRLGVRYTPYYLLNALEVDGGPLLRAYLLSRPEVDRVLDSPRLRPIPAPPPPEPGDAPAPAGPGWNIRQIGADRVWRELGVTGAGIVIGQSDSGADGSHPDLAPGYRGAGGKDDYSWLDPWYAAPSPRDYGFHGSHTLGTAAGRGGIGVAPGASWIACVNLARNLGNPARYLDCMQFMLAPYPRGANPLSAGRPELAAHVLNNSWGCPPIEGCDPASLEPAVRALRAAGIFVVASAGNAGAACGSVSDPIAIYAAALSVGAVDSSGQIAPFSSRGPVTADGSGRSKPEIVAPGVDVISSAPGGTFASASGTSMAGPHVAGVVALIWSANPRLIGDIDRTERILLETARPAPAAIGCAGPQPGDNVYGRGEVDAYAAVRAAQAAP